MRLSEFNNVSNFVFYCKKKKKKKEKKYLEIMFLNSFPILRNKTELINKNDLYKSK